MTGQTIYSRDFEHLPLTEWMSERRRFTVFTLGLGTDRELLCEKGDVG